MLEDSEIKLCWLICIQPFEKKEFDIYEDYEIQESTILFNVPILDNLHSIKKAEFVRYDQEGNDQMGSLFVQTED